MARPLTAPNGRFWTEEDRTFVSETMELPVAEVAAALNRSEHAIEQARTRVRHGREKAPVEVPVVRKPGDYIETLAPVFVEDFECMEIWLKWNGYACYTVVGREDRFGLTLICTAK
jgi:hypothetical protein